MYSPALLDIDSQCGQIRRSAPTAWTGVGMRYVVAHEIWVKHRHIRAGQPTAGLKPSATLTKAAYAA